ncbi:S-formylglutathione hydrolase [Rubrivivax albus]|uniref:S-formylglutathione hydrolase n=1 Tax=Rubrivivax albus TaxID=2499835 RepID=A0A437JYC6_9BURK|nr:S-formylglutathione hydrolase [Rubrivivax albus]RVT52615.1 S-formylglutathione hydrolase [Rubrivivax albus]
MAAGAEVPFETTAEHACFGGVQRFCRHTSAVIGLPMRFAVYQPPKPSGAALVCLAGLTCTEETFAIKAGAQRVAAELGLTLLMPDTSPRATGIAGEDVEWDFGSGAGFYLDATAEPWARHFRMESWLLTEWLPLLVDALGLDAARIGITGHSMGGHGALTLALRHPGRFRSLSAFAPIAAPSTCPWGEKAFSRYLGEDRGTWAAHDASALMRQARCPYPAGILVDQGLADKFLVEQLKPEALEAACSAADQPLTLRRHAGYDHGYFFIQSVVADHLRWHAERLG